MKLRLAVLFFLQFACLGAWVPILGKYLSDLGFSSTEIGAVYATSALAVICTPLLVGHLADRFFPIDRVMAFNFIVAGILLGVASATRHFLPMFWASLGAMFFFGPTVALANAFAFRHLNQAHSDFPLVRSLGTVGWIAAGYGLSSWMALTGRNLGEGLKLGAVLSTAAGLYCLTLPSSPPFQVRRRGGALTRVTTMLRGDRSFAVFSFVSFGVMVFGSFYYARSANFFPAMGFTDRQLPLVSGIGQCVELGAMWILPRIYRRLGPKATIGLGISAWSLRFAVFAAQPSKGFLIAAQSLHGVAYAFGTAAASVYLEQVSKPEARATLQSYLYWLTYGAGMLLGSLFSGQLSDWVHGNWMYIWGIPATGCAAMLVVFWLGFKPISLERMKASAMQA